MATTGWDQDEQDVMNQLGVGEDEIGLRNLIIGQRKINGRLYTAIKLILDSLPAPAPGTPSGDKIARAREITEGIPGPPPDVISRGLAKAQRVSFRLATAGLLRSSLPLTINDGHVAQLAAVLAGELFVIW
jgi:hypothetical protein